MSLQHNFSLMAEYNQWMNRSIYAAASTLSQEALVRQSGAFFGSILGTLNHLLVGDIIWLKRFAAHPEQFSSLVNMHAILLPKALDQVLYEDLAMLRDQREALDKMIITFVNQLTAPSLNSNLTYQNTKGITFTKPFAMLLQHFFNHQTHHRGQLSTLLSQSGVDIGVTDVLAKIPER